jgi:ATP-binding cassette subfamily B protein
VTQPAADGTPGRRVPDLKLLQRLYRQAWPYRGHVLAYGVVQLLAAPLALLVPLPLKIAVDTVLGDKPPPAFLGWLPAAWWQQTAGLWLVVALVVLISVLVQLQQIAGTLLQAWTGHRLVLAFRARLFEHAQRLSLAYHDTRGTADSIFRIQYDTPAIQHVAVDGLIPLASNLLTLVAMVWVIALLDWRLAAVAMVVAPVLLAASLVYRRRLRQRWREVKQLESAALSVVHEALGAVRVVKAFGQEEREGNRFRATADTGMRARLQAARAESVFGAVIGVTIAAGTAGVLGFGVTAVQAGTLTLGNLLLVMAYVAQLYGPLKALGNKAASLQGSLASAERAFALLDEAPDVVERPGARPLQRAAGAVAFEGVGFAYRGGLRVLRDVSFRVPAGARVGIEGPTGAGKTTLMSLLCRFYDADQGRILLDGVDLRDWRVDDLRRQFGIVLQEPVLFSTSIAENIAYARPGATAAQIEDAARAAGAHDFICALPAGYETPVGERGMRLSGGERQRISLARAFLRDAPILILDEPTSSVDVQTEAGILDALQRLMQGRTTFMIAHRLGTLAGCDVRLEVRHGTVLPAPGTQAAARGAEARLA